MRDATDVVVAGGSVAGCALAALLGRQGASVTVLEKSPKPEHYKVVCSHFIQAGATPVLRRLGVDATMERAGALRNGLDVWTAGGWYTMPDDAYGYNLRREKLDPMLRELAARTPNVTVRQGVTVDAVLRDAAGRPSGLRGRTPGGEEVTIDAQIVVGADGRGSNLARLAGIPGRVLPHNRFGYMAYYEDLELRGVAPGHSQMWLSGRDVLYCFPNDDGVTIAAVFLHKDRLPEFKAGKEAAFLKAFSTLDRAPDLAGATRVSPLIGKLDLPNVRRPAARPGIAFVGDAAQASDPVWGVGVGFALESAAWLADELAGALTAGVDPDPALERYRRRHRRELALHHLQMSDFANGRELNLLERAMHRAATRDPQTASVMAQVAARAEPLERIMTPRRMARAMAMAVAR